MAKVTEVATLFDDDGIEMSRQANMFTRRAVQAAWEWASTRCRFAFGERGCGGVACIGGDLVAPANRLHGAHGMTVCLAQLPPQHRSLPLCDHRVLRAA